MRAGAAILAIILIAIVLVDAFCTIILARRTDRTFRVAALFYRWTWPLYSGAAKRIESGKRRENYLSVYGPLSLLALLAAWAVVLVLSFAVLQWSAGLQTGGKPSSFGDALYFSGTTLFNAGTPSAENPASRILNIAEAGTGMGFLGLVISYLPVLYTSYSSRELSVLLLDARAGVHPTAGEFLQRHGNDAGRMEQQLNHWEHWAAELIQNQLSYPMLAYFRSLHGNHSWLTALVAMIDASAIAMMCGDAALKLQAEATFDIGQHALADLCRVFKAPVRHADRLTEGDFLKLRARVERSGDSLSAARLNRSELDRIRRLYEPEAEALGRYFLIALPHWLPDETGQTNRDEAGRKHHGNRKVVSEPFASGE